MFVGDTFPDAKFAVSDETGLLDLSTADSIEVNFVGKNFEFSGSGAAIQPADDQGNNLGYTFADDDTSEVDVYEPEAIVTWTTGKIETFPTGDTLTVKAHPTTS